MLTACCLAVWFGLEIALDLVSGWSRYAHVFIGLLFSFVIVTLPEVWQENEKKRSAQTSQFCLCIGITQIFCHRRCCYFCNAGDCFIRRPNGRSGQNTQESS